MKFLIVFACALAAASAGHLVAPVAPIYPGAQHLPVIGANGVPVDTPAVQQATAAHFAQKVEAQVRNGDYQYAPVAPVATAAYPAHYAAAYPAHYGAAYPGQYAAAAFTANQAYPTTAGVPAVTGNGVPLETPEVVAAKTAHFAAHGEALARTSNAYEHAYSGHYIAKRGVYAAAPFAYTAPAYSYGAYGHHYLAKRGVYTTPLAYSAPAYTHGYTHAYPYAQYY